MRLTRPLAALFAGALLVTAVGSTTAEAAPSKTAQVAAAYKKARTLYRQGKYNEAIKAFDEVKDLRYHPILDYGIANCYAALRDYNKGIYYLEKYIKNFAKFKMSPKHPTVADVKEKIKSWKKLATNPGGGGGTPPAPGVGTSGTTGGGAPPTGGGGDPVPGPDPYAVPPPPGGGTTGGVYGGGGGGNPPPPVVRRRSGPARRSLILSVDLGPSSFAGQSGNYISDSRTGFGIYGTALWRIFPYFAVGVHGGAAVMTADDTYYDYSPLIWAVGMLEARVFIPLGRLDLWASADIGYGSMSQDFQDAGYDYSWSMSGPAVAGAIGVDWFFSRIFSLGIVGRIYKVVPTKYCETSATQDGCDKLPDGENSGVSWYFGLAATYHFPLSFGRRR